MTKLFNISEAANIAIHSLALIASTGESHSAANIARTLNFSRNHVAKVLQLLSRENIISSTRGPKGGFGLKKKPAEISVFAVIEMIDGKMDAWHCKGEENICPFEKCIYGDERQELYRQFKTFYSNRTIEDIKLKSNYNETEHH